MTRRNENMKLVIAASIALSFYSAEALKIGFVGDTGAQESGSNGYDGRSVYEMFEAEGVDLVVQNGDLDYESNPAKWDKFLQHYAYSKNMEVLVSSGNHEEEIWFGRPWYGSNGYKAKMNSRFLNSAVLRDRCSGAYGERFKCEMEGSLFVMIGWKQHANEEEIKESRDYLERTLKRSNAKFKFCTWHQPEGKLNNGNVHTSDYGLVSMYEVCRQYGAVITSGHVHVYGRTKLMSSFANEPTVSTNSNDNPTLTCGETFAVVIGMGGYKFDGDGEYANKPYWTIRYSENNSQNVDRAGAFICDTLSSNSTTMNCEFRLANGGGAGSSTLVESFQITTEAAGSACTQAEDSDVLSIAPAEDVEESLAFLNKGNIYEDSSDLEMTYDLTNQNLGTQAIGLRYTNVGIPQGATINKAFIRFTADGDSNGDSPNLIIAAHDLDDSPAFGNTRFAVTTRATTSFASWNNIPTWKDKQSYNSVDLKAQVQAVVNRPNWKPFNAISFIIKDENEGSNVRQAEANEGEGGPTLVIDYGSDSSGIGNENPLICSDSPKSCLTYNDGSEAFCSDLSNYCDLAYVANRCPNTCNSCSNSICEDRIPSGLQYSNGCPAPCSELKDYCYLDEVKAQCAATCNECSRGFQGKLGAGAIILDLGATQPEIVPGVNPNPNKFPITTILLAMVGVCGAAFIVASVLLLRRKIKSSRAAEIDGEKMEDTELAYFPNLTMNPAKTTHVGRVANPMFSSDIEL